MKIISNINTPCRSAVKHGLGGLLLIGFSVSAWGVCVQDPENASIVIKAAGNQACENISGQIGCRVEKGNGECDAKDDSGNLLFTAKSSHNKQDGLNWTISVPAPESGEDPIVLTKVDAVTINGAQSGNACVYIYEDEAIFGERMGDYDENKENFTNVQYAEFCTDSENQTVEPSTLPDCSEIANELDGTGINCDSLLGEERFLISLDPNEADWNATACTCNITFNACDEEVEDGGVVSNKCTGDNPLRMLPVHWEAGNDGTYICRTIGGVRKCWRR